MLSWTFQGFNGAQRSLFGSLEQWFIAIDHPPVNKHSNGKFPSWIGNTSSNGGFSIAMFNYRSVVIRGCFFFYQDPPIITKSHRNGKDTMWEYIYMLYVYTIYIYYVYISYFNMLWLYIVMFQTARVFHSSKESKLSIEQANASLTAELKREAASSWLLMAVVGMLIASSKFGHDHIHSFKSVCHTCTMLSCPKTNALFSHRIWDLTVPLVALSFEQLRFVLKRPFIVHPL